MNPHKIQFVLLSLEAWCRLHDLDALLDNDHAARAYHELLYDVARHSPYLNITEFRQLQLIQGPQALILLLPAIGLLASDQFGLGIDEARAKSALEQQLQGLGLAPPRDYARFEAGVQTKRRHTSDQAAEKRDQFPRVRMMRCIRNAAAHHMEHLADDSSQGIIMPEDGMHLSLITKDWELHFEGADWPSRYIQLITDIMRAARRLVRELALGPK